VTEAAVRAAVGGVIDDRRDFQVIAPRHLRKGERLKLLPDN
jgi:hypothetical protein